MNDELKLYFFINVEILVGLSLTPVKIILFLVFLGWPSLATVKIILLSEFLVVPSLVPVKNILLLIFSFKIFFLYLKFINNFFLTFFSYFLYISFQIFTLLQNLKCNILILKNYLDKYLKIIH